MNCFESEAIKGIYLDYLSNATISFILRLSAVVKIVISICSVTGLDSSLFKHLASLLYFLYKVSYLLPKVSF